MVSRASLGVCRRYRDDVRLDSRFAKTGWQWCHVLVSGYGGATAATFCPPRRTGKLQIDACLSRPPDLVFQATGGRVKPWIGQEAPRPALEKPQCRMQVLVRPLAIVVGLPAVHSIAYMIEPMAEA